MRETIRIEEAGDPRIAAFRDIRERDLTGRQDRFIAEGTVVLRVLAQALGRFAVEAVLLLSNRVNGVRDILARLPDGVPVYVAEQAVMNGIVGFDMHRGVLALGRRVEKAGAEAVIAGLPQAALAVVCCGISNHDNIGAIFRNAAALGADAVLLDETCCDPLYRKALRVSVGAVLAVPCASPVSAISRRRKPNCSMNPCPPNSIPPTTASPCWPKPCAAVA